MVIVSNIFFAPLLYQTNFVYYFQPDHLEVHQVVLWHIEFWFKIKFVIKTELHGIKNISDINLYKSKKGTQITFEQNKIIN